MRRRVPGECLACDVTLLWPVCAAADARLGWMGDIEDADHDNAHAVGELGRLDPAYSRSERVRARAKALAKGAAQMEEVFEKVRLPRVCDQPCACVFWCALADVGPFLCSAWPRSWPKGARRASRTRCCSRD